MKSKFSIFVEAAKLFYKRIPYFFLVAFCIYGLAFLSQLAYYRFMPGSWFLRIESAKIDDLEIGQDINLTLCRTTRYPNIKAASTRSYYRIYKDGKLVPAGEYEFKATYEANVECQVIHIPPSKHPNLSGDYYVHTESTFNVQDGKETFQKVIKYDTNRFHIYDTQKSIEDQIKGLQEQIDGLRAEVGSNGQIIFAPIQSPTASQSTAVVATPVPTGTPTQPPTPPAQTTSGPAPQPTLIQRLNSGASSIVQTLIP